MDRIVDDDEGLWDAAQEAWREHRERQYHSQRAPANPNTTYLNEFGIPTDDYLPVDELRPADGDFVDVPGFHRPQSHGAVGNLDVYLASLYQYYYHRGILPIVLKGLVELTTLAFTLTLSVFLFAYLDWHKLLTCVDEASCEHQFAGYLVDRPFARWTLWNLVVILYCIFFCAYTAFAVWSFLHTLREALDAKWVFEERLGIASRKLIGGAVDWDQHVVAKLVELQESGEYRIAIADSELDALVIANRILRKENFLVALFNKGLIDLHVPGVTPMLFCSSLEWSLYFCILNFMFNHKYNIRPAFYLDPAALRRRFVVCGVAHAIFMPFLLFFMTLHFGLTNAYDWKSTKRYLGPREWSLSSLWLFREFNELPHNFERRLAPSYEAAEAYLKLFGQSEIVTAVGRVLVFIGGSLGAVLFVFAAINDAILLHVKIADWNLLWFAGMVGVLYSTGKAMIPTESSMPRNIRNMFAETDAALKNVANHTHYYMETWKGRGSDVATYKAMAGMFKYKAQKFAMEVAAVIVAPYILCVSMAKQADAICEYIFAVKSEVKGAGEVCGFATFDFDKFSDEAWEGRTLGPNRQEPMAGTLAESVMRTGNLEDAARNVVRPKARHGKMEKSFFSFKANHPSWKCSASGQSLVDRVERYQRAETAALTREQELHIEAAARQLETLARLDETHRDHALPAVDESYIPKTQAPADAGAGMLQGYVPPSSAAASLVESPSGLARGESHEETQLPFVAPTLMPRSSLSTLHRSSVAQTGLSLGLSSELRRILNMSTLDPDVSVSGSLLAGDPLEDEERRAERQYLWLERYHAHVAAQQQQQRSNVTPRNQRDQSSSDYSPSGGHSMV